MFSIYIGLSYAIYDCQKKKNISVGNIVIIKTWYWEVRR